MVNKPINFIFFLFSLFDFIFELSKFLSGSKRNRNKFPLLQIVCFISPVHFVLFWGGSKGGPFKGCLNKDGKFNREDSQSIWNFV